MTSHQTDLDTEPATRPDPDEPEQQDRPTGPAAALARGWRALVAWRLLPVALFVIAALLAALGAVMLTRAHADRAEGPMANQALVSTADTEAVVSQVSTALNQILSYDTANPTPARQAASHWLTGDAPAQYRTLVDALAKVTNGQRLTMVAKVSTAAVVSLHGNTAQLLVFVDQQSTRASDRSSSVSAAQVRITAVRTPQGWRISDLVPL
jgi:Mce-associated membrane protein